MDWSKCILCGKAGGDLRCQIVSRGMVKRTIISTVQQFKEIDAIPMKIE